MPAVISSLILINLFLWHRSTLFVLQLCWLSGWQISVTRHPQNPKATRLNNQHPPAIKPRADNLAITTDPRDLFTLADAEKILGEPAHLVDSGWKAPGTGRENSPNDSVLPIKRTASSWGSAYEANAEDKKTGRTGKLYFKIEQYPNISSAMTVYSYYKRSNETHPGFKEFHDIADEGWTGNSPVSVYMRKGNKIFGIKVNRPTSKTSTDGFNEVVKKIAAAL
jgi:hypothetical protein